VRHATTSVRPAEERPASALAASATTSSSLSPAAVSSNALSTTLKYPTSALVLSAMRTASLARLVQLSAPLAEKACSSTTTSASMSALKAMKYSKLLGRSSSA